MPDRPSDVLKAFRLASADLRTFLGNRPALTDSEQLAIENCLLMLQIEYARWRKDQLKTRIAEDIADKH